MMHSHRIRALSWQVRAGSQPEAFALRKRLRDALDPVLLPAIDRVFEEAAPQGEVLRIPRLAVHIRIAAGDPLAELLAEALRRRLLELLREAPAAVSAGWAGSAGPEVSAVSETSEISAAWMASATPAISAISSMPAHLAESKPSARSAKSGASGISAISPLSPTSSLSPISPISPILPISKPEMPDAPGASLEPPLSITRSTLEAERLQILLSYLETGDLPWSAASLDRAAILEELRLAIERGLAVIPAVPVSRDPVAFYFRLLQLIPEEEWVALAANVVAGRSGGELGERLREAIAAMAGARSTSRHSRLQLAAAALATLGADAQSPVARQVAAVLAAVAGTAEESLAALLPGPVFTFFQFWLAAVVDSKDSKDRKGCKDIKKKATGKATAARKPQTAASSSQFSMFLQSLQSLEPLQSFSSDPAPGEAAREPALIARLGGLILLHPFLPRFFESTGVLEEERLERPRAAALLHLLAAGDEEPFEHELGFIKILLGLRPGAPLPIAGGLLRETDREEAEALLQAVIGHWNVLKNTSPEGLRHTFLQRRGLLREKEDGYHLQLEPESFDVLLGFLPWGIGTVKLPWMKKPIFTDWPAR